MALSDIIYFPISLLIVFVTDVHSRKSHGGSCLQSQHLGHRGRRSIVSLSPA